MRKLNCIQGDKFGDWTVIDNTPVSKWGHIYILKSNASVVK